MNNAMGDRLVLVSWMRDRLPEYLWIALIIDKYDRTKALEKLYLIFKQLSEIDKEIPLPVFSQILQMEDINQKMFFDCVIEYTDKDVLAPLTLLYHYSEYPIFSKLFCNPKLTMLYRQKQLNEILRKSNPHQSNFATDIRFLVLFFLNLKNKLIFNSSMKDSIEGLSRYPYLSHDDEEMRSIRPFIRSSESMSMEMSEINNKEFLQDFWVKISIMSECELYVMNFPEEKSNTSEYIELVENIFKYFSDLFVAIAPLDKKMLVLFGIATYSYKRVREISDFKMFNSISARSTVRVIVENFIMMKYLILQEPLKSHIWDDFQEYGIGLYKAVVARSRDKNKDYSNSHIDPVYLEILVNHHKNEEFIDIDTSYFDKQNIRDKAIAVNEKDLWDHFYDYGSSYEHGLWGSIVESSLLMCDNPSHQGHYIPDVYNQQRLKNIWFDCVMIMNKTLMYLNDIYEIPVELLEKIKNYEQQLSQISTIEITE